MLGKEASFHRLGTVCLPPRLVGVWVRGVQKETPRHGPPTGMRKAGVCMGTYTRVSTAAVVTVPKRSKQPECPPMDGWINNKRVPAPSGVLLSRGKEGRADTRVILSERSQTPKLTHCIVSFLGNVHPRPIQRSRKWGTECQGWGRGMVSDSSWGRGLLLGGSECSGTR